MAISKPERHALYYNIMVIFSIIGFLYICILGVYMVGCALRRRRNFLLENIKITNYVNPKTGAIYDELHIARVGYEYGIDRRSDDFLIRKVTPDASLIDEYEEKVKTTHHYSKILVLDSSARVTGEQEEYRLVTEEFEIPSKLIKRPTAVSTDAKSGQQHSNVDKPPVNPSVPGKSSTSSYGDVSNLKVKRSDPKSNGSLKSETKKTGSSKSKDGLGKIESKSGRSPKSTKTSSQRSNKISKKTK